MNNIFEKTVKTLTNDVTVLQSKYHKCIGNGDIKSAIDTLRLLKDSLSLIKEYDWRSMNSKYEANGDKYIAIWEQNHCGHIRNHQVYKIENTKFDRISMWYTPFKDCIETHRSYILDNGHLYRGYGKTYTLAQLCVEYNGYIVYKIASSLQGFRNTNISNIEEHFVDFDHIRGMKDQIIFIDECSGLTDNDIDYLKTNNTVIGFIR